MPYARKTARNSKKARTYRKRTTKPVAKATVKSIVKSALNAKMETKIAVKEHFSRIAVPGAGLDTANSLGLSTTTGLIPNILRGTDDAGRSGDIIHPKRLVLKYSIRARDITSAVGTNPYRQPFLVRVIVYNHRYAIDDFAATQIIDKGATAGNLDSSPDSWLEPYNRKEFKIHYSKTFKLAPLVNSSTATVVTENMPNGYQYFAYGRISLKVPAKLFYNGSSSLPVNSQPQLAFAVCNVDGTPVPGTQFRCEVNAESQLYYTDA